MSKNNIRIKLILAVITVGVIAFFLVFYSGVNKNDSRVYVKEFKTGNITSIKYQVNIEEYGYNDGKRFSSIIYTCVYPDKLRIEKNIGNRTIEIYNNNKYIYFDITKNKMSIKECFPIDNSCITDIEKSMKEVLENKNKEFFGYEERNNIRLEIIGVKWKDIEHSYMRKFWMTEMNGIKLPYIEEYFIDNRAVSKRNYNYFIVNEAINPEAFKLNSNSRTEIVNEGALPKYLDNNKEAESYVNFTLKLPKKLPMGIVQGEIAVIPPVKNPSFYCIYFRDGYRIYLRETTKGEPIKYNGKLGNIPCRYEVDEGKIVIRWLQEDVDILISGDPEILDDIMYLLEEITGEKPIKYEM